jgi:hypothetical protein
MGTPRANSRLFLTISAMLSLGGCAGLGPATSTPASWVAPSARHSALLYVSDQIANEVFIYAYPALTPAGELTGFNSPAGLCVNHRNGNVWVADMFHNALVEFQHGGSTPIRTIHEGASYVNACSVDARTGKVASIDLGTDDPGLIVVSSPGHARLKEYSDYKHAFFPGFGAYDSSGTLYVDATRFGRPHFGIDELAKGSNGLTNIPWKGPYVRDPGGVVFDGTDLAIGDESNHTVYRTNGGAVVATIALKGACMVRQFSLHNGLLIAPNVCKSSGSVLIYGYPAGGEPVNRLTGLTDPYGAVISP